MKERQLVKIIKEICLSKKISCNALSYDWIIELKKNNVVKYIFGYKFPLNSAADAAICDDKSATSELLTRNSIPSILHHLVISPSNFKYISSSGNWKMLERMLLDYGALVCKPNDGTGGTDVYHVTSQRDLELAVDKIFKKHRALAVSPYYEIEAEYRVIVLNNKVKLTYTKERPHLVGDGTSSIKELLLASDNCSLINFENLTSHLNRILYQGERFYVQWKHNLGSGAKASIISDEKLLTKLSKLALRAASALNIIFASIDIAQVKGELIVLEVNSGVMMENFSLMNKNNYELSKSIYEEAVLLMFKEF